jgi:hypothetical protein
VSPPKDMIEKGRDQEETRKILIFYTARLISSRNEQSILYVLMRGRAPTKGEKEIKKRKSKGYFGIIEIHFKI